MKTNTTKMLLALLLLTTMSPSAFSSDLAIPLLAVDSKPFGHGYDHETQELIRGECVTGNFVADGTPMSSFDFSQQVKRDEVESVLGLDAGAKIISGTTTTNASAKYLKHTVEDSHSITINWISNYYLGTLALNGKALTPATESLVKVKNIDAFKKRCGSHYVAAKEYGASLLFNLKITFGSVKEKQIMEAKLKMDSTLVDAFANLENNKKTFSQKTLVTLRALQVGGDVAKITGIISGTSSTNGADVFVKCSMGEFDSCAPTLMNAISYATDKDNGFPSQLKNFTPKQLQGYVTGTDDSGAKDSVGPAVLKTIASPYNTVTSEIEISTELDSTIKQTRKDINAKYVRILKMHQLVEDLVAHNIVRYTAEQKEALKKIQQTSYDNLLKVTTAAEICFTRPIDCGAWGAKLNEDKTITEITDEQLTFPNVEFAQFCDLAMGPVGSDEEKKTMAALMKYAMEKKPGSFAKSSPKPVDECGVAGKFFETATELDLANMKLVDISVFETMKNLRKLNLSHNEIVDASALKTLLNLTDLNLNGNKILNIDFLKDLSNLESVRMSANKIEDASVVSNLSKITLLDMKNNSSDLQCPFTGSQTSACRMSDFTDKIYVHAIARDENLPMRAYHTAQNVKGRVVILGGQLSSCTEDCVTAEFFDLKSDSFLPAIFSDMELEETKVRFHQTSVLNNGDLLVTGGINNSGNSQKLINSKLALGWDTNHGSMNEARYEHTATNLNSGDVLVTGGWASIAKKNWEASKVLSTSELYVAKSNQFFPTKNNLQAPRAGHTATHLGASDKVLIAGGFDELGNPLNSLELYDAATKSFKQVAGKLKYARGYHQSILMDDKVFFIGGHGSPLNKPLAVDDLNNLKVIEFYDLKKNVIGQWTEKLDATRVDHRIVALDNNLVLVAGGSLQFHAENRTSNRCTECTDSMEILDMKSQSVTQSKDKLPMKTAGFSLTKLVPAQGEKSDRFLFLGGNTTDGEVGQAAIIWTQF